jgi:4-hydroxy-2-oxoheptanedioate aldolase
VAAVARVLDSARRHGVVAGIHTGSPAFAARCMQQGFQMVTLTSDAASMGKGAWQDLQALRKLTKAEGAAPPLPSEV